MKIAVIGSGIAGMSAAWLLQQQHQVTLFERDSRPGGHSNTIDAPDGTAIDTGFIVFNDRTYPNLVRLFQHLGIADQPSDMSFAVSRPAGAHGPGFEYSSDGWRGLLAYKRNLLSPRFHGMIRDLLRFYREVEGLPEDPDRRGLSLGTYLAQHGYGQPFVEDHLLPMAAAIWSAGVEDIRDFPVGGLVAFLRNHGLLSLRDRPKWRTVQGGSRAYVERLLAPLGTHLRTGCGVVQVAGSSANEGVRLTFADGSQARFDHAILACHADQALDLLADPSVAERRILGAFRYSTNRAVLHSDARFMPTRRAAWASWNYLCEEGRDGANIGVTYWMNRLQRLAGPREYFVTLNPSRPPSESSVLYDTRYTHPILDQAAIAAQPQVALLQGQRGLWYCGAHLGFGFHEDGLASGLAVAEALGDVRRPWRCSEVSPAGAHAVATAGLAKDAA